jgi:hypothetical protein
LRCTNAKSEIATISGTNNRQEKKKERERNILQ